MGDTDHTSEIIQKLMTVLDEIPDQEQAQHYKEKLTELKKKYEEPEFRLAVIGNYSCGKSTFLNALLRRNMLTVDTRPTTAIPTYIRWNKSAVTERLTRMRRERRRKRTLWQKILDFFRELFRKLPPIDQYPSEPYIIVHSHSRKEYILLGDGIAEFETDMGISLPNETDRIVDYLTTTNALAQKLQRIDLSFPEREGFQNFCLIDTPGVNPGDDASQQHIVQTQSVLRNEADAAIVLYPAKDAMSKNLEYFMAENAAHLMGDAIVLLTKMDIVPTEQERRRIIERTKRLVAQRYQQLEPVVHGISAYEALEYCCSGNKDPGAEQWFHHFNTVFSDVFGSMKTRRNQIANKRIDWMLVELMRVVNNTISASTAQLTEERQGIQDCSAEHLEEAFRVILETYHKRMDSAGQEMLLDAESIVRSCIGSRRSKMLEMIDSARNSYNLNYCLTYTVPLQMADVDQAIVDDISGSVLPRYTQINSELARDAEACLKEHHRLFGEVTPQKCVCPKNVFTSPASVFPYKKGLSDRTMRILHILTVVLTAGMYLLILLFLAIADFFTLKKKRGAEKVAMSEKIKDYERKLLEETASVMQKAAQENDLWAEGLLERYQTAHRALFDATEKVFREREGKLTEEIRKNQSCLQQLQALQQEYYIS